MKIKQLLECGLAVKKYIIESGKRRKPQEIARQDATNQGDDPQTAGKQDKRTQGGTKVKDEGDTK